MQEFRFLENDENSCLLKIEDKVWVTETDQPELVVKIGNAIAEGKAFNYDSELVLEIKEFLEANGLTIEPIPSPFTYSNNKKYLDYKDMATSSNEFIEHKGPKVAFIGGNSLEVIKKEVELINNSDTPYVAVILLEDEIIISHVVDKNTPCLSCLYERWIESHKQKFQYAQLHSDIPIIDDNFEHIYKESLLQLTTKSNKVKVINKYTLISEEHDIVAKESCKKCYGHQLNMADISLEKVITNIIDNGNRATHPRDVLKKITIGPFSPVTRIIENGDEDILNLPVFQSFIGGKPFEKSFIVHGGKGLSYYQAKMSAVGEALERYKQVHGNEKMVFESYNSLRRHYTVLDPKRLCLDKDYPNKYDYYKKIEWVLGKNLMTNKETYLPSNAVFFVYQPNNDSLKFMPQDTTGLASGSNIEEAVYQGLCEVIERDSYAIYYRQRLKSPTIDTSTIDDINIKYLLNLLKHKNISVHLKHLKNDSGVHVIHSVTENLSKEYPIYTHGAGASLNPDIAIQRAITESIQLRVTQQVLRKSEGNIQESENPYFTWGLGKEERVKPFIHNLNDKIIHRSSLSNNCSNELSENIGIITNSLKQKGYEIFVANLSRADNPLKTVRVIIPGYQGTEDTLRRITNRMFELPKILGVNYEESVEDLNEFQIFS